MRTILFRGLDNMKIWRYGSLVIEKIDGVEHAIILDKETGRPFSVDRKTVGQFTGKEDFKKQRIFEGDLVDFDKTQMTIVWEELRCRFEMVQEIWGETHEVNSEADVIGNIFINEEKLN